jgi:hypothetical protein
MAAASTGGEDSAVRMRYRVNSNATDVGGQRTDGSLGWVWVWDAHRFEHLCGQPATGGVRQAPPTALDPRPSPSPASVASDDARVTWE